MPTLQNCFKKSKNACCNYAEDSLVGDQVSSFVPEPCMGDDDHAEIDLFACLACDATNIFNFTVKAEATNEYMQQI